ncbi:murein L,D-transpeptidase, partial [Acinetobacter variabilis]
VERSAASSVVAQPASSVADNAVSDPQVNTGVASAVSSKLENTPDTTNTTPAPKVTWTLDSLNNSEWYENIGKGQFPVYARAHVMLNNAH